MGRPEISGGIREDLSCRKYRKEEGDRVRQYLYLRSSSERSKAIVKKTIL